MGAKRITNRGFIADFAQRHEQLTNRRFCFILGAGASRQSGIPTAGTLVHEWLREMHLLECPDGQPIENWATAATLDIDGFTFQRAASFYPQIYQRRFRDFVEQGYAALETALEGKEPSFGYSVLAQILATERHNVAITVNFDNLIADALAIYMRTYPLVCGHESLTGYIRPDLRRPLIAKVHRDLLLDPKSTVEELAALPKVWADALSRIFGGYTPVVIGYGGNDGSLMSFLEKADPITGGIFWCHIEGSRVDPRVEAVVERHRGGGLVPIAGFDELMLQLQVALKLPNLLPEMQRREKERIVGYQQQFEKLNAAIKAPAATPLEEAAKAPVREAAQQAVDRMTKEMVWWAWELKAAAEDDPAKKEALYRDGLTDFPSSSELTGNFAIFMEKVRKEYDEAERLYRRALELDPADANHTGNFALFLHNVRKEYDEAERLYRRALELDPADANHLNGLGFFLATVRERYEEAQPLLRRAVTLAPDDGNIHDSLAVLLVRLGRSREAEEHFKRALELEPESAAIRGNYDQFVRKRSL